MTLLVAESNLISQATPQTTAQLSEAPTETTPTFKDFQFAPPILKAVNALGFEKPTIVQQKAIPSALAGKNLLVSSQTGSGKTAAFMLPTLQRVFFDNKSSAHFSKVATPEILVLCPTRELVTQVAQDTKNYVRMIRGARVASVIGGMPFRKQIHELQNAKIVIATPGRLLDLTNRRKIRLDKVKTLIADEADRMLDMGFIDDLQEIHEHANLREQTLMFSATFEGKLVNLAKTMTGEDSVRIEVGLQNATNKNITQKLHWADGFVHKKKLLQHWLNAPEIKQVVVFASTKKDVDMLAEELEEAGKKVVALHGDMQQKVRNRKIRMLREGKADILVATDVAARGLDVPGISHVINFGLPMRDEDYVHRIGRTGRAGRSGTAITIALHSESRKIYHLERYLKEKLAEEQIEGLEPSKKPKSHARKNGNGKGYKGHAKKSGFKHRKPSNRKFGKTGESHKKAGDTSNKSSKTEGHKKPYGAKNGNKKPHAKKYHARKSDNFGNR